MEELKIKPISITTSRTVKGAVKSFDDIMNFHIGLATELNRVVGEINKSASTSVANENFESTALRAINLLVEKAKKTEDAITSVSKRMSSIESSVERTTNAVKKQFDDIKMDADAALDASEKAYNLANENIEQLKLGVDFLKESKPLISSQIKLLSESVESELATISKKIDSSKKEIDSNRNNQGFELGKIHLTLNELQAELYKIKGDK